MFSETYNIAYHCISHVKYAQDVQLKSIKLHSDIRDRYLECLERYRETRHGGNKK